MALRLVGALLVLVLGVLQRTEAWNDFCQLPDIVGVWNLRRDQNVGDEFQHCSSAGSNTLSHQVTLSYPNVAKDEYGNYGTWTTIYGISIEITIHGRKYFSYFKWNGDCRSGWRVDCGALFPGSSRDILTNNYACFDASKSSRVVNKTQEKDDPEPTSTGFPPTFRQDTQPIPTDVPTEDRSKRVEIDYDLIDSINRNDIRLWEAEAYDHLQDLTEDDLIMMAGGNMSTRGRPPKPAPITKEQLLKLEGFPRSFDWRNVEGQNYVSSVRSQGRCGSCYAFAALAMYESRIRIISKNTVQPILSPQDILDCNPYSYGCYGGWIYPEGRFAEEFGFVDETCNSYNAEHTWWTCKRDKTCQKYYATDYQYVGGYFGASNEYEMMDAILNNGPVVVGYAVYLDFIYYRKGVYYHAGPDRLLGYHAVAVVGWGKDERSGTKYWIAKNSWGKNWGEDGYFRIIRGNNDCDFEASAFEAFPMI